MLINLIDPIKWYQLRFILMDHVDIEILRLLSIWILNLKEYFYGE